MIDDLIWKRFIFGRTDLVYDILDQKDDPAYDHGTGVSLINWCAYYGDVSIIRYLLSQGAELNSLGENYDLSGAAFHGHWQLCEYLLEFGAEVNFQDKKTGETALHAALSKYRPVWSDPVVSVLVGAGADPNLKTARGVETGSFMRDCRTRGETSLHRAAAFASPEAIQRLIDSGADLKARDCNGDTPLTWASYHIRDADVLRLLLYDNHRISDRYVPLIRNIIGKPITRLE